MMEKKVKAVVPVQERRSYERVSFFLFIFAMVATIVMEYLGVTADQVTKYAEVVVSKTFSNIATFSLFIVPIAVQIKEMLSDWQKRAAEKEIKIAEIEKTGRISKPRVKAVE